MEHYDINTSRDILRDIGATLASERERQGLTVSNVSQRLCILEDHITCVEIGNLDDLPAMTYVIGFVRSYARMLDLDDSKLCGALKGSLSEAEDRPEFDFIESRLDKNAGAGRVALAAVIAGVLIYGGWYSISFTRTPSTDVAEVVPSTVQEDNIILATAEALTTEAIDDTPEPKLVLVTPRDDEASVNNTQEIEIVANAVTQDSPDDAEAVSDGAEEATEVVAPVQDAPAEEITKVTDAFAVNRSPEAEIIIEAIANSWVEVTRADGTPVSSRLMRQGDTYLVPSNEYLFLTTGNAGGLNIRMGKDEPFTLGSWGESLRELPLNKAIIATRY